MCSYNATEMEFGERSYILSLFDPVRRSLSYPRLHSCLSFRMQLSSCCCEALKRIQKASDLILGWGLSLTWKAPSRRCRRKAEGGGNFACQATHNYLHQGKGSETFSYPAFFFAIASCAANQPLLLRILSGVYKRPFSLAPPPTVSVIPFERKPLFKEKRRGKIRSVGLVMASSDPLLLLLGILLVLAAAASEAEAAEDGRGRGGEGGRGGRGGPFGERKPKICK